MVIFSQFCQTLDLKNYPEVQKRRKKLKMIIQDSEAFLYGWNLL